MSAKPEEAPFDFGQEEVQSEEDIDALMEKVSKAAHAFQQLTQEQVDKIFYEAAYAACQQRIPLAIEAAKETNIGVPEDKVIKNHFASEYIYNKFKDMKTVGVIDEDPVTGIATVAEPLGILAGILPTTNPTSTAIFKCLIALKTRNCIVLSPHHRAARSSIHAARICRDAAIRAGAPEYCISWITRPCSALSGALMRHKKTSAILATGGPGMVYAAYSSGNPAIGVGPGNVPCLVDETVDIRTAVSYIIQSKTFDNGVICASEQAIICATPEVYEKVQKELVYRGCYILNDEEAKKVGDYILPVKPETGKRALNPTIVGRPAREIAERSGVHVPEDNLCKLIIGRFDRVAKDSPWSCEKLSPTLGIYCAKDFYDAVEVARQMIDMAGAGHSAALHTAYKNKDRIDYYTHVINAGRILVNCPSALGGIGDLFNFELDPSLTLGCGSYGKNSVSTNVGPKDLLNFKKVAITRYNTLWLKAPPKLFFGTKIMAQALQELKGRKRALLICGKNTLKLGFAKAILDPLEAMGIECRSFTGVVPDPNLTTCMDCLAMMRDFKPDICIGLGGGSAIDLMKMTRLFYEHEAAGFEELTMRFLDIRKRIYVFPECVDTRKAKSLSVCIPTTSGTGSEVTPFAVITDDVHSVKYPLADYQLMPHIAIVDGDMCMTMPKNLAAWTGVDALVHALEAYVSTMATEYTQPLSLKAIKMIFESLPTSVNEVTAQARETVHHAATLAGMAFANAFLGIVHSCAHKLGQKFHIPHGLANAIMLIPVIRFNSAEAPVRQAIFPQYQYPCALRRYAEVAEHCGFVPADDSMTDKEKVKALIAKIEELYAACGVSRWIKDTRDAPSREEYMGALDYLSYQAFDDQCTGTNPRYPFMPELAKLFAQAYSPEDDLKDW